MNAHNRKVRIRNILGCSFCILFFTLCVGLAQADAQQAFRRAKGIGRGKVAERKEELLSLRREDPEKFKALVREKQTTLKKKLGHLKETDPQKYQEVMKRIQERKLSRLKRLKEENPALFKQIVEKRRASLQRKLELLKEKDPERYQKIMATRDKLKERLQKNSHKESIEKNDSTFEDVAR